MLEKTGKYVSFFSVLFFLGAIWFEFLYYKGFGVDIFTFISFSEIIGLFIGHIPTLLFISFFVVLVMGMLTLPFLNFLKKLWNKDKYNLQERRKINSNAGIITLYIGTTMLLLLFVPLILFWKKLLYSELYIFLRAFVVIVFIYWGVIPYLGSRTSLKKELVYIGVFVLIFFVTIHYYVSHQLWSFKNDVLHQYNSPKRIILNDSTILNTNDTLFYIGKTNNYIFIYIEPKNNNAPYSTAISMEHVKSISTFKKVGWLRMP